MDHQFFRVALSPLVFQGGRLVPITYVIPPIAWRLPAVTPTAVSESGLLLLSTMLPLNIPSFSVVVDNPVLKEVSDLLYEQPFVFDISRDEMKMSFAQVIKEMEKVKEELTELKQEDKKQLKELRDADIVQKNELKELRDADIVQKNELKELREADIVQKQEIEKLKASNERIQLDLIRILSISTPRSSPGTTPENTPTRKRKRRSSEGGQPLTLEY